ncbi:MAG: hypothetical protein FWH27_11305 [Planctomycetaceae bacterium]|nr:hypothetical protein [Planctomycetaceae bacterium]
MFIRSFMIVVMSVPAIFADETIDRFSLDGKQNIMAGEHLGVVNHHVTTGTPYDRVGSIDGLWAPPYVSSDFACNLTINSKLVPVTRYVWWPMKFESQGILDGLTMKTSLLLIAGKRAAVQSVTLHNESGEKKEFSLEAALGKNTLDWSDVWEFSRERSRTPTTAEVDQQTIIIKQGAYAVVVATNRSGWIWDAESRQGRCSVILEPGQSETVQLVFAMGVTNTVLADIQEIVSNPERSIARSEKHYVEEFESLYEHLPRFHSDNKQLERLYDRSVMHFFMNHWDVKEFCLHPYYGTGSVRGGCVCNYLWNYGETWEIIHLLDPAASREHIKHFLGLNLTKHFAFLPVTGKAFGPWYMINQEKIIGHVYFYVKLTGDADFLSQQVDGRTIMDHMLEQALALDDPEKPVALIDYGPSNSHLELRRKPNYYNHVMPDLNGRRYDNYIRVAELAEIYGEPKPFLVERAESLKQLLKEKLWNRETRWFDFINDQEKLESRYTIQMYKLIGSPLLDHETEAGLLSHWNENEFLGKYGVHSLALQDEAFDPADIDNGGPGACTCFPPQIAERFYKAGHPEKGGDIIHRILWWADRLPYWGDSVVAHEIDYRRDTPLQCTLDSVAVAQCMIFGMFGIDAGFDGTIVIQPSLPDFARTMSLQGVTIRGLTFDIDVTPNDFTVTVGNERITASPGKTVFLKEGRSPTLTP